MNPKAKAENLIEKFIPNTRIWNDEKKIWEDCIESAKICVIITVDEILNEYHALEYHDFIEKVLKELGVKDVEVEHADVGSAVKGAADVFIFAKDIAEGLRIDAPTVVL